MYIILFLTGTVTEASTVLFPSVKYHVMEYYMLSK